MSERERERGDLKRRTAAITKEAKNDECVSETLSLSLSLSLSLFLSFSEKGCSQSVSESRKQKMAKLKAGVTGD